MTNEKIELKRCPFCNGTAKEEFVARGILGSNKKTYTLMWISEIYNENNPDTYKGEMKKINDNGDKNE